MSYLIVMKTVRESLFCVCLLFFFLGVRSQQKLKTSNTIDRIHLRELSSDISANIVGLLTATKDVFLKTASFSWGQAWFKMRGYEAEEQMVWLNGIPMASSYDNKPDWSSWGGLNEVLRNAQYHPGSANPVHGFSNLGGSTCIATSASSYKPGSQISTAISNNSYTNRFTVSHFTGMQKSGWAAAFLATRRFASQGRFSGTSYDANSLFFALEKKISSKHSIHLTGMYAYRKRGKNGPNTQEVLNIKGPDYNPYWGSQNGHQRNARMQINNRPFFVLNHNWKVSAATQIKSAVLYHFGNNSQSRLGYANAPNPDPTHYSKLPSYAFSDLSNSANYNAYGLLQRFENGGQIDWDSLYFANTTTQKASYFMYEDRENSSRFCLNFRILQKSSKRQKRVFALRFDTSSRHHYARLTDLLGVEKIRDVDPFISGISAQSNLKTIDRDVLVGEAFKYNFKLYFSQLSCFLQQHYEASNIEHRHSIRLLYTQFHREGLYQNGQYPSSSYGESAQKKFLDWGLKTATLFKVNGRNLLGLNLSLFSRPIALKNAFSNVRVHNTFAPDCKSALVFSNAINYYHRGSQMQLRLTYFYSLLQHLSETSFMYVQGYRGDTDDFVSQTLANISKKYQGLEIGVDFALSNSLKTQCVASLGSYTFANRPDIYLFSDSILPEEAYVGKAFVKNYKLGGTAQNAYALGIEYNAPTYWWLAVNYNLLTHNYVRISPLLRSSQFYTDSQGIPFVDQSTGDFIAEPTTAQRLPQERLENVFLANIVGGKSWKFKGRFVRLFIGVNNIFGKVFKTGGFEQSRKANYQGYTNDTSLKNPLFGNKYWMGFGPSYFVNISLQL